MGTISELLESIATRLAPQLDPVPERVFTQPSALVAWDDCCTGQLAIRLIAIEPVTSSSGRQVCGPPPRRLRIGVSLIRCVSVMGDDGTAPTPDQLTDDAVQIIDDAEALERLLVCDISQMVDSLTLGSWISQGPEGGCAGGELTFTVLVLSCIC